MSQSLESDPVSSGKNRNSDGTFKVGVSGNPKGRPKGIQQIPDVLRKIGNEDGTSNGEYSKLEVVLRKVFESGLNGNSWAVQFIADRTEGKALERIETNYKEPIRVFDFDD